MLDDRYLLREIDLSNHNLGTIKQFSTKEIIQLGEEELKNFLFPFLFTIKEENIFDYLFVRDEQAQIILSALIMSLQKLYKTDDYKIDLDKQQRINIIIADAKINNSNFNLLCSIVRDIFFLNEKQEEESRSIQVSEENKAILEEYLRLEQEHKKEMEELNKKHAKTLHQVVTIVASQCEWDYDKVLDMTYYRLINTYTSIFKIDSYTTYMQYKTSGQFDMKNYNIKHWVDTVGKLD